MSLPIVLGCLWVLAASAVAMLPMRWQYPPGIALLLAAPVLIVWLGVEHHWLVGVLAFAAFISLFRNPLRYFWRRARGLPVTRPEDMRE